MGWPGKEQKYPDNDFSLEEDYIIMDVNQYGMPKE